MPASRFTRKANTPRRSRQWQHVYESAKSRGASPGSAIRQASGVVRRTAKADKRQRRTGRRH
jgi:hypothetical protein